MSDLTETYVERAKRLGLDPTEACIACNGPVKRVTVVGRDGVPASKFCHRHVDWETAKAVECESCGYQVGLVCGEGDA